MSPRSFLHGVSFGAVLGVALAAGVMMSPKQRNDIKRNAKRAARSVGHVVEDIGESMHL